MSRSQPRVTWALTGTLILCIARPSEVYNSPPGLGIPAPSSRNKGREERLAGTTQGEQRNCRMEN